MEVSVLLTVIVIILTIILTYQKIDFKKTIHKLEKSNSEIDKLRKALEKELNKPKSQEFINFLSDFNNGGAILSIEPINKNDIYFHNSGK